MPRRDPGRRAELGEGNLAARDLPREIAQEAALKEEDDLDEFLGVDARLGGGWRAGLGDDLLGSGMVQVD